MRRTALVLAAAALLVLPEAPARARPSDPFVLRASGGEQRGAPLHFTEKRKSGPRACVTMHGDGTGAQEPAVSHDGSALVWRLRDARKPFEVRVTRTRWLVRELRLSVEQPDELDVRLRPVRSGRRVVAWEVVSEPVGTGDMDFSVSAQWHGACGDDSAAYLFHVRAS